jgi:hypothetical protein
LEEFYGRQQGGAVPAIGRNNISIRTFPFEGLHDLSDARATKLCSGSVGPCPILCS